MKRFVVVVLLISVAACKHTVDNDVAEKLAKKVLEKDQLKPTDVSCPSNEAIHVGNTFDCTAMSGNKVELTVHVTQVEHASGELSAEGAGGDYKLEATIDDAVVTRGELQRGVPGADVSKCPEAAKLDKVGAKAACDVTIAGAKKKATAIRTDHGVDITTN